MPFEASALKFCKGFLAVAKDLKDLNLEHLIRDTITPQLLGRLADKAVEMMKTRARLGMGVSDYSAPQQKFEKLTPGTIDNRRRMKKQGTLAGQTTPAKSNLTATGELLDSIKYVASGKTIEFYLAGPRNQKVATLVSVSRPFFNLSKAEVNRLAQEIEQALIAHIKKGK